MEKPPCQPACPLPLWSTSDGSIRQCRPWANQVEKARLSVAKEGKREQPSSEAWCKLPEGFGWPTGMGQVGRLPSSRKPREWDAQGPRTTLLYTSAALGRGRRSARCDLRKGVLVNLTQKDLRDLPFGDKSQEVLKEQAQPGE